MPVTGTTVSSSPGNLLATLADLKNLFGSSSTDQDSLLLKCLDRASAQAEKLAGLREGALRRSVNIVEFPSSDLMQSKFARLDRLPIESVSSVKQLWHPGTDDDFTDADELVENEDYLIDPWPGKLERINSVWFLRPRCLRVVHTAGFVDPAESNPPVGSYGVPQDLQHGVLMQAQRLFHTRETGGLREVVNAGGGGSITFAEAKPHPALVEAVMALKRII
jgi:hypothetical protein